MQTVTLRSAIGRTLYADQLQPQRVCRTPTVFIWLHGLASVRRSQKSDALLELACKWGAGYLRVDMTGHGESDGRLGDVTVSNWIEDVECALQHVVASLHQKSATVSPRIIMVGYSLGGLVAARLAARQHASSRYISALVLLAPGLGLAQRLQQAEVDVPTGMMCLPSDYMPGGKLPVAHELLHDLQQHHGDDAATAKALKMPTFIAHGENDETVAIENVVAFHDRIGTGPAQSRLVQVGGDNGGDHRLNTCIDQIVVEMENFLKQQRLLVA